MEGNPEGRFQKIYILTGKTGSGKSTFLGDIVVRIRSMDLCVGGFIAASIEDKKASRFYEIRDLSSSQTMPLASEEARAGWMRTGSFYFNPEALSLGYRILTDPVVCENDLIVVDEIGPFELEDKIWADAITCLLDNCSCPMLWTVRKQLIKEVTGKWQLENIEIIDIEKYSVDQAAGIILSQNTGQPPVNMV